MKSEQEITSGSKESRITTLDGIRGIAVLMVIAFHYINNQIAPGSWIEHRFGTPVVLLKRLTYFGWTGVNLFFILSGFLIGNILLRHKHAPSLFKTFYARRFFRIIPVYYLLIAIFFLLPLTPFYNPDADIFSHPIPVGAFLLLIQNFYMAKYDHFGPQALTPTWSLCVEEQFYLIIPLLVFVIKRKWIWVLPVLGIAIALVSRSMATNFYEGYVLLSSRIDSPMIGFLLACLHQHARFREWVGRHIAYVWGLLLLLLLVSAQLYIRSDPGIWGHTLLGLLFGLVVVIALYSPANLFTRILSIPFLLEMGKLSYFLYLFHQLVNGLLHLVLLKQSFAALDSYRSIMTTTAAFVITYVLAVISFRYVEKPLISYSHRFKY